MSADPRVGALRALSSEIRDHHAVAADLESERNQLIRDLVADGRTHAQIAEATGLTRGRIGQIALGH